MDLTTLRAHCSAKPGATEGHPFGPGALVFKVAGKIFAIVGEDADPLEVSVKCEPEFGEALRRNYPAVRPGYHLDKRHWITVVLDGTVADGDLRDWVDDSYDLVVAGLPRRERERLGHTPT